MDLSTIIANVNNDFLAVHTRIANQLNSEIPLVNEIVRYVINNHGKGIRPLIALLSAKACGYEGKHHIDLGAIVEILHTATLLHDDVVDVSTLRRGRATVNQVWGNSGGVLAGDLLYTRAFRLMLEIRHWGILDLISETAQIIAEGEFLQMMNLRKLNTAESDYLKIIECKTAALFRAAAESGAIICGGYPPYQQAMRHFGLHFGLAFQLIDDILDYQGKVEIIGKNIGEDLTEGKPTLPLLYAYKNCNDTEKALIKQAIETKDLQHLAKIIDIIQSKGGLEHSLKVAKTHEQQALHALTIMPESPFVDALRELTLKATQRDA